MKPGPRPKPTKLKKLAGNPGQRPLNSSEPQFEVPGRMLNVPDFMDDRAAEVWRDLGARLLHAGLLTYVDKYAFAMFCVAAGRWIEAEIKLKETGGAVYETADGNLAQNPHVWTANKAWDQMRQMFGEFGLTPAERARLSVEDSQEVPTLAEQLKQIAVGDG